MGLEFALTVRTLASVSGMCGYPVFGTRNDTRNLLGLPGTSMD